MGKKAVGLGRGTARSSGPNPGNAISQGAAGSDPDASVTQPAATRARQRGRNIHHQRGHEEFGQHQHRHSQEVWPGFYRKLGGGSERVGPDKTSVTVLTKCTVPLADRLHSVDPENGRVRDATVN